MKKIFFITLLYSCAIWGFQFEEFKSGENIEDIVLDAEQKNLPMTYHSYNSKKYFSWKELVDYKKYHKLHYSAEYLNTRASVYLYFNSSKKLYKIDIKWHSPNSRDERKILNENLINALNKKYGKYKNKIPLSIEGITDLLFGVNKKFWEDNDGSIIILSKGSLFGTIELIYIDPSYLHTNRHSSSSSNVKF